MKHPILSAVTTVALGLVLAVPAHAIDKCKVQVSRKTGVLVVTATGVSGTPLWGDAAGAETEPFFNAGTCLVGTKAKKCQIADPTTLASETPPADCRLYLDDGTAACVVRVPGCTPGARGEEEPVCGDGHSEGAEACDGLELNGQTCVSAGFLYGTLACDACALDTSGCTDDRYEDNGDGTVTDHQTKLMWEQKTGTAGGYNAANICPGGPKCGDVHDVNNLYSWSTGSPYNPDGVAFFDFLAELNGPSPFAGHDDWRLPTITELQSIVDLSQGPPTIDQTVFGPTQSGYYWSPLTYQDNPDSAWSVLFSNGYTYTDFKTPPNFVRAVRTGS